MQSVEFSQEHSCAVVFVSSEISPEDFIYSLKEDLKHTALQEVLVVCSYTLILPFQENSKNLEIIFFLIRQQGHLHIDKVSIDCPTGSPGSTTSSSPGSTRGSKGVCMDFPGNKTATINLDVSFYTTLKKEFFTERSEKFIFSLNEPFFLEPVYIPKPWGQEIWFTGVEKRGVSNIASLHSKAPIPLPWFFSALPKTMLGAKYYAKNLVLIKILDPLPEEIYGDLYCELHTEKNEVYIVTHISSSVGRIKIGINPAKMEHYKNNIPKLRKDFEECIKCYEIVRRKIDTLFDSYRKEEGISPNEPILVNKSKDWMQKIPNNLIQQEIDLRKKMDEFSGYLNLQVGDVISVPILNPHALQHGVRVIEFQTPTYERLIISFAQKVLTQDHWDTEQACKIMKIEEPKKSILKLLDNNDQYLVEEVCSFPDFYSSRVILKKQKEYILKSSNFYQILFMVKGNGKILMGGKNVVVVENKCIFVPSFSTVTLIAEQELVFLICSPESL